MKRRIAAVLTGVLLALAIWWGRGVGPPRAGPVDETPEACLDRMFVSAEAGQVDAYLDCFTGAERQRLERQLAGQPREAFARSLSEAVSTLKGRAVFRVPGSADGGDRALRTVDRVYANRTERQEYQLVRQADGWRVESVRTAAATQPEKPYGSPVFDE